VTGAGSYSRVTRRSLIVVMITDPTRPARRLAVDPHGHERPRTATGPAEAGPVGTEHRPCGYAASLPSTVKSFCSTQLASGPSTVGHASTAGFGLMLGPSTRTRLLPVGLPAIACGVAASPT
jgi:hypothetical protein